jgi:hypothetical protein
MFSIVPNDDHIVFLEFPCVPYSTKHYPISFGQNYTFVTITQTKGKSYIIFESVHSVSVFSSDGPWCKEAHNQKKHFKNIVNTSHN